MADFEIPEVDAPPPVDVPAAPDSDVVITVRPWVAFGLIGVFIFILGLSTGYVLGENLTIQRMENISADAADAAANAAADAVSNAAADEVVNALSPMLADLSIAPQAAVSAGESTGAETAAAAHDDGLAPADTVTRFPISADDDPFLGPEDAPVVMVEFSDYQCPFCARFRNETLDPLLARYPDELRFVFRDFPLDSIHPQASAAAVAANCANEQGRYWEMHDILFAQQDLLGLGMISFGEQLGLDLDAYGECLESGRHDAEIRADFSEAAQIGVTGTPTFFINGRPLVGAQPIEVFIDIIDDELALLGN